MTGREETETDSVDDDIDEDVDETEMTDTQILTSSNLSDDSVEINVEQLVTDIETVQSGGSDAAGARRRLESLLEEKRLVKAMRDLDDFDFDD